MISAGFIEPSAGCVPYAPGTSSTSGAGVGNEVLGGALSPPADASNEILGGAFTPVDTFSAEPTEGLLALEQGGGAGSTGGIGNIGTPEGEGGSNGPGSAQLLGAREALQRLCEVEPDRPVLYGAGNALLGLVTYGGPVLAALITVTESRYFEAVCNHFARQNLGVAALVEKHLKARRLGDGVVKSFVPGHGGDVWFVENEHGQIAAYSISEMVPAPVSTAPTEGKPSDSAGILESS